MKSYRHKQEEIKLDYGFLFEVGSFGPVTQGTCLSALLVIGAILALGLWGCSDSDVTGPVANDQIEATLKSAAN